MNALIESSTAVKKVIMVLLGLGLLMEGNNDGKHVKVAHSGVLPFHMDLSVATISCCCMTTTRTMLFLGLRQARDGCSSTPALEITE